MALVGDCDDDDHSYGDDDDEVYEEEEEEQQQQQQLPMPNFVLAPHHSVDLDEK